MKTHSLVSHPLLTYDDMVHRETRITKHASFVCARRPALVPFVARWQLRVECCKTKKQAKAGEWTLVGSFRADNIAGRTVVGRETRS